MILRLSWNLSTLATVGFFVLVLGAAPLSADEKLEGIACRSVHLGYSAGEGTAFYNEVVVERSAAGTYFCACGWDKGYFGIQEIGNGKKVVLFSVWDSNQNDPKAVGEDKRETTAQGRQGSHRSLRRRRDRRAIVPRLRLEGRRHLSLSGYRQSQRSAHGVCRILLHYRR